MEVDNENSGSEIMLDYLHINRNICILSLTFYK
jgi:hypothetical protein